MSCRTTKATHLTLGRRGEDQPRLLLFFFIIAAASGIIAIIIFLVVGVSTSTSKAVLEEQENRDVFSPDIVQSLGTILSLRYADSETASCIIRAPEVEELNTFTPFIRTAILTMRFRTNNAPDRCDMFVNGILVTSERRIEADCGVHCPFTEFNRQFTIGELDYRDSHIIKVCCNDICVEKTLERLCNT
jgi:hypothetical protein